MDPTRLMNLAATVTPRVVADDPDEHGNDVLDDGTPFATVCFIWQNSHRRESVENTGPENITEDTYSAGFPADVTIAANAKVTVDGFGDFEVDGNPWPAYNPREKRFTHQEVTLRRVA